MMLNGNAVNMALSMIVLLVGTFSDRVLGRFVLVSGCLHVTRSIIIILAVHVHI